jgi:hypothetical protein
MLSTRLPTRIWVWLSIGLRAVVRRAEAWLQRGRLGGPRCRRAPGHVLLGAFAYTSVKSSGHAGLLAGSPGFFGKQITAALFVAAYAFAVTGSS